MKALARRLSKLEIQPENASLDEFQLVTIQTCVRGPDIIFGACSGNRLLCFKNGAPETEEEAWSRLDKMLAEGAYKNALEWRVD